MSRGRGSCKSREIKLEVNRLTGTLHAYRLDMTWERAAGISAFLKSSQFEHAVQERIDRHMRGEDVRCQIREYWDHGYNACKKQTQALFALVDFSLLLPEDEEVPEALGERVYSGTFSSPSPCSRSTSG
ncbi:hypothetical protein U1Q18_019780 [Sarracenia purpurea var. burkii]